MVKEKLKTTKLKPLSYLLNRFVERDIQFKTPKNSLLLGAGCSISSGIPSGGGVMDLCKKIAFLKNHSDGPSVGDIYSDDYQEYIKVLDEFISNNNIDYASFTKTKEQQFLEQLSNEDVLDRIPKNIKKQSEDDKKLIDNFTPLIAGDNLYGKWFEEYSEDPRERQRLIELLIEQQKYGGEYILLANLIKHDFVRNVFTTNFDDLLNESLLIFTNTKARVYAHNEVVKYLSIGTEKPNIIKLHGDYLYENIKNIGKETYELGSNMKVKFKEALNYLDLIVIGYGGADKSIMSYLEEIKQERQFGLIWCGTNPLTTHWRIINLINNTTNSFFIQIESFSQLIFDLWRIADKTPMDLMDIAKFNQDRLNEHLSEFNKNIATSETISGSQKEKFESSLDAFKLVQEGSLMKDSNDAIKYFNQAINLNPNYYSAYLNRGIAYSKLLDDDKALVDFMTALRLDQNDPWIYFNLGVVLERKGQYKESLNYYKQSLELKGIDQERLYNNIGVVYRRLKDYEKAKEYVNKAIEINPKLGNSYGTLALIASELGEKGNFFTNIELALKNGCPVWDFFDDHEFRKYKNDKKVLELIQKYKQ